MKTQLNGLETATTPQLRIVEDNVIYFFNHLTPVKKPETKSVKQIKATDPTNWDESWFSNYE